MRVLRTDLRHTATRDLCTVMLEDSARIQEGDFESDLKQSAQAGKAQGGRTLVLGGDVAPAMALFQTVNYNEVFEVLPD